MVFLFVVMFKCFLGGAEFVYLAESRHYVCKKRRGFNSALTKAPLALYRLK